MSSRPVLKTHTALSDGMRRLFFINGVQVPQVLGIETPRNHGELAGVVSISFVANEIVERHVSSAEFKKLRTAPDTTSLRPSEGDEVIVLKARSLDIYPGYRAYECSLGEGVELQAVVGYEVARGIVWVDAEAHGLKATDHGSWGVPIAPIKYQSLTVLHERRCVVCLGPRIPVADEFHTELAAIRAEGAINPFVAAHQAAGEAAWRHEVLERLRSIDQTLTNVTEGGNAIRVEVGQPIRCVLGEPLQSLQAIRFVDPAAPQACPVSSGSTGLSPLDSEQSFRSPHGCSGCSA